MDQSVAACDHPSSSGAQQPQQQQQQTTEATAGGSQHGQQPRKKQPETRRRHMSNAFMLQRYKISMCKRTDAHNWRLCPYAHEGEAGRRRPPHIYQAVMCDYIKTDSCPHGSACPYAHNPLEYHLHPDKYRTTFCSQGEACTRNICFFAHNQQELRLPGSQPREQPGKSAQKRPDAATRTADLLSQLHLGAGSSSSSQQVSPEQQQGLPQLSLSSPQAAAAAVSGHSGSRAGPSSLPGRAAAGRQQSLDAQYMLQAAVAAQSPQAQLGRMEQYVGSVPVPAGAGGVDVRVGIPSPSAALQAVQQQQQQLSPSQAAPQAPLQALAAAQQQQQMQMQMQPQPPMQPALMHGVATPPGWGYPAVVAAASIPQWVALPPNMAAQQGTTNQAYAMAGLQVPQGYAAAAAMGAGGALGWQQQQQQMWLPDAVQQQAYVAAQSPMMPGYPQGGPLQQPGLPHQQQPGLPHQQQPLLPMMHAQQQPQQHAGLMLPVMPVYPMGQQQGVGLAGYGSGNALRPSGSAVGAAGAPSPQFAAMGAFQAPPTTLGQ